MHTTDAPLAVARGSLPPPLAGVVAGIIAGTAYLLAQTGFVGTLLGGEGSEPLQRIAAMLLGPDAAPPPAEMSLTVAGIGLLIHFGLSIVFGRLVAAIVGQAPPLRAVLTGGAVGLGLYFFNFWLVAPAAFPWFEASPDVVTAADHWLFGAVAGLVSTFLRNR